MNTANMSRADMRAVLKSMGVKGAASMLRPECETLLADVAEEGQAYLARVTEPVTLTAEDEQAVSALLDRPRTAQGRTVTAYFVCGHCEVAPRQRDPDSAHACCRMEACQCSLLNHRPDAKVRAVQALACHATVEQCEERDPGRSWDTLTAVAS